MKRLLLSLLSAAVCLTAQSETSTTPNRNSTQGSNTFFVPWKPLEYKGYKAKSPLVGVKAAGMSLGDFLAVESHYYDLNYYEKFRYAPGQSGFFNNGSHSLNFMGVGKIPLSEAFTLFAKAGPGYSQSATDEMNSSLPIPIIDNPELLGFTYSSGASVSLSSNVELSLEYMHSESNNQDSESGVAQLSWNF